MIIELLLTSVKNQSKNESKNDLQTAEEKEKAKQARMFGPIPHEDLLAEDVRVAKRNRDEDDEWAAEPTINLGVPKIKSIKVRSLGPILNERFKYG